jgi:hypothetical protein
MNHVENGDLSDPRKRDFRRTEFPGKRGPEVVFFEVVWSAEAL